MTLDNKTIHFLGDSITWGAAVKNKDNCFTKRVAFLTGATCNNYGIGGTRIARQQHPSDEPRKDRDFCSRVDEMDPDADIVVVFGGTNDFGHGDAPFGTDRDGSADTFCGALHVLYRSLIMRYPKALIAVITPLHRIGEDNVYGEGAKEVPSRPLKDYVEQIRKMAKLYGFPILDLYNEPALDPNDDAVRTNCMPDGLHPNDAGHIIITDKIVDFLRGYEN